MRRNEGETGDEGDEGDHIDRLHGAQEDRDTYDQAAENEQLKREREDETRQ